MTYQRSFKSLFLNFFLETRRFHLIKVLLLIYYLTSFLPLCSGVINEVSPAEPPLHISPISSAVKDNNITVASCRTSSEQNGRRSENREGYFEPLRFFAFDVSSDPWRNLISFRETRFRYVPAETWEKVRRERVSERAHPPSDWKVNIWQGGGGRVRRGVRRNVARKEIV